MLALEKIIAGAKMRGEECPDVVVLRILTAAAWIVGEAGVPLLSQLQTS